MNLYMYTAGLYHYHHGISFFHHDALLPFVHLCKDYELYLYSFYSDLAVNVWQILDWILYYPVFGLKLYDQ
jgi:hypothetical protein